MQDLAISPTFGTDWSEAFEMENDTRGWILTAISGIACCFGASIICVDVFARQFPSMRNFKITESDAFLSASLSLSAGVILFSSLYSMLPESKNYLQKGGYSPRAASFLLIGIFLIGVFGIRILSQIMHRFIPSHIVDCDHTHDEETDKGHFQRASEDQPEGMNGSNYTLHKAQGPEETRSTEDTPLLSRNPSPPPNPRTTTAPAGSVGRNSQANTFMTADDSRRPSSAFTRALSRTFTKYVSSRKDECDQDGPCMGFSDPCGQDCFKIVQRRGTLSYSYSKSRIPSWQRAQTGFRFETPLQEEGTTNVEDNREDILADEHRRSRRVSAPSRTKSGSQTLTTTHHYHHPERDHDHDNDHDHHEESVLPHLDRSHTHGTEAGHHHHVPTNAFMSIGLQTSVAIALHKAPEGFITFATNHANPALGFSVFIALFIHNITEGFALSLPLYLALNSRFKAILWSALLGGMSQPLGAGVAALWFKVAADSGHFKPDEKIFGGIFAVTAGIMASVAMSLIAESLQLSHSKNTCVAFAFIGMGLLGVSTALTAS